MSTVSGVVTKVEMWMPGLTADPVGAVRKAALLTADKAAGLLDELVTAVAKDKDLDRATAYDKVLRSKEGMSLRSAYDRCLGHQEHEAWAERAAGAPSLRDA